MRIIAGEYRSRVLKTLPGEATRPTLDKVREAVFSHLGPYFDGGNVLDLFSGSGAIGLECLSRGFDRAVFNDKSHKAVGIIKENIASLKLQEKSEVWSFDYKMALARAQEEGYEFDLIYLDPPYRLNLISELCELIAEKKLLKEDGIIVAESLKDEIIEVKHPLVIYKQADYGISRITYIRNEGE